MIDEILEGVFKNKIWKEEEEYLIRKTLQSAHWNSSLWRVRHRGIRLGDVGNNDLSVSLGPEGTWINHPLSMRYTLSIDIQPIIYITFVRLEINIIFLYRRANNK